MKLNAAHVELGVEASIAQLFIAEAGDEGHTLDIQAGLEEPDASDIRLGMDTYYLSLDEAEAVYGGVRRCAMTRETITLTFSEQAAVTLGTDHVEVRLGLPAGDMSELAEHLRLLFTSGRSTEHPILEIRVDGE